MKKIVIKVAPPPPPEFSISLRSCLGKPSNISNVGRILKNFDENAEMLFTDFQFYKEISFFIFLISPVVGRV